MSPLIQRILLLLGLTCILQFKESTAIICYDCNSEYDPRCGDPFDPYTIGEVNCSKQEPLEHLKDKYQPTLCRKTLQKIYGKLRVVRGCGYIPDDNNDKQCLKRSGTHDVQAIYCACTTDKCNGAHSPFSSNTNDYLLRALPLVSTAAMMFLANYNRLIQYL